AAEDEPEPPDDPGATTDLYSVFVEVAGLRSEVRTESRLVKEALDQFRDVFDLFSHSSPNSCRFMRQKIPSDQSRNDGGFDEPSRRCGSGTSGLGQIVAVCSGDPLDHPDVEQSAQLPR